MTDNSQSLTKNRLATYYHMSTFAP